MLTSYQCEVIAFHTGYGDFVCYDCGIGAFAQDGGEAVREYVPMIRYSMDEEDEARSQDWDWSDDDRRHAENCGCTYGVQCEACGCDIVDPWESDECGDNYEGDEDESDPAVD